MALRYIYDNNNNKSFSNVFDDIVIFSPSFYWFKICEIPTKNYTKAKNIATHMMSDGPIDFKKIELQRIEDKYAVFSYNESIILNILKELNIKDAKIYFADQLNITESIAIDEEKYLFKFNNKIIELDKKNEEINSNLNNSYSTLLEGVNPIISLKKDSKKNSIFVNLTAIILFIYLAIFSFDKINTLTHINKNSLKLDTNGKSFYEIKSLIKKYKKLEKNSDQMKINLEKVLKQNQIKSIEYKNNKIRVTK